MELGASVDALNRGELLFGETSAAQHIQGEVGLPEYVALDIVGELHRQALLQLAIAMRGAGVRTEIVADRKLIDDADRAFRAHVQVVSWEIGGMVERLAVLDAEIAEMAISKRRQPRDRARHVASSGHDDGHVDNGLRRQARHRRASHVLEADGNVGNRQPDPRTKGSNRRGHSSS